MLYDLVPLLIIALPDLGSGPLLRMAGYSSLQGHCTFSILIISSNCIEVHKYFACFTLQKDIKHPMKESHYMCKKSGSCKVVVKCNVQYNTKVCYIQEQN